MFRREDLIFGVFRVAEPVRVIEQSEPVFRLQNPSACLVYVLFADETILQGLAESPDISSCDHIHVQTGFQRPCRHFFQTAHPVIHCFSDRIVVGHHESVKPPPVAQHILEQERVQGARHPFHLLEGRHYGCGSRIHGSPVRLHIPVEHTVAAHVGSGVVPSCIGGSVEGIVLHAGKDLIIFRQVSLISSDVCFGNP